MTQILDLSTAPLEGKILIEASAGTGKTYTLTVLFVRLLLEKNLTIDQILVVTFTDAATEELRATIRARLKELALIFQGKNTAQEEWQKALIQRFDAPPHGLFQAAHRLEQALRNFDLARIFTIHGFCQHVLTQNSFECSTLLDTELVPDLKDLYRQVCVDFWREHLLPLQGLTGKTARQAITPDSLMTLACLPFLAQPLRCEPQELQPSLEHIDQNIRNLCSELANTWPTICAEVRQVFLSQVHTLHKGKFTEEKLEERLQAVQDFIHNPGLDEKRNSKEGLPGRVYEMTQTYVDSMATQKFAPPQHSLFSTLEHIKDQMALFQTQSKTFITTLKVRFIRHLLPALDQRKQALGVQGFDDLLRRMHEAIQQHQLVTRIRAQYQVALIDEFQDTDGLQYQIFNTIFALHGHSLFFIGDPKQAIYSFRGADLYTYLEAGKNCQQRFTLGTNYRSTPEFIDAINRIFLQSDNPFLNDNIQYQAVDAPHREHQRFMDLDHPTTPPLTIWEVKSPDGSPINKDSLVPKICQAVTAEISRLLMQAGQERVVIGEQKLQPGHIAILVETNNQALAMHQALAQAGIASVTSHNASVWASAEASQLLSVLQGIVRCQHQNALRTALAMPLIGLTSQDLEQLDTDNSLLEEWFERFLSYHQLWERHGVMAATQRLFAELQVRPKLVALPHGERRLTNVLHCLELLQAKERETNLTMHLILAWFQQQLSLAGTEDAQLRLDTDRDAVQIVTIHKSKGLQYPVVFCPFVYMRSSSNQDWAVVHDQGLILDLGSENLPSRQQLAQIEDQGEKIRLLYVALTRAQAKCYLVWGYINQAETSGAAWLFHGHRAGPDQHLDWKTLTQDQISQDLQQLVCPDMLEVVPIPETNAQKVHMVHPEASKLYARDWQRQQGVHTSISSFTGLTKGKEWTRPGLDEDDAPGETDTALTMANFPRGATAGTCLHQIFEHIDFTRSETIPEVVHTALSDYGYALDWQEPVQNMVQAVLETDLHGFGLQDIDTKNRIVELEFLFPLRPMSFETLIQVYQSSRSVFPTNMLQHIEGLRFEPRQGYVTGFADLVVRWKEYFYLLDWKSNWLGPTPMDYTQDKLEQAMAENLYFLQYHLYCLALHRYLSKQMPGYDPVKNFGGVRYVFLRGVNPKQPGQGVYADQPDPHFLTLLDQTLIPQEKF